MSSALLVLNDIRVAARGNWNTLSTINQARATDAIGALLRHARGDDWLVAHVLRERAEPCRPISGLEPLRTEHVFLLRDGQGPNLQKLRGAVACGLRTMVVASFALNDVSATILRAGLDLGVRVSLAADAGDLGGAETIQEWVEAGVRVAPASQIISGSDGGVVWLRDFVSRRAGHGGSDGV